MEQDGAHRTLTESLQTFETKIDVTEIVERSDDAVKGKAFHDALLQFALAQSPESKEKAVEQAHKNAQSPSEKFTFLLNALA